jgi:hypothetical protein
MWLSFVSMRIVALSTASETSTISTSYAIKTTRTRKLCFFLCWLKSSSVIKLYYDSWNLMILQLFPLNRRWWKIIPDYCFHRTLLLYRWKSKCSLMCNKSKNFSSNIVIFCLLRHTCCCVHWRKSILVQDNINRSESKGQLCNGITIEDFHIVAAMFPSYYLAKPLP